MPALPGFRCGKWLSEGESLPVMSLKRYATTTATLFLLGVFLVVVLALLNRRNQAVGYNQEIQYDDFAFSVVNAKPVSTIGNATAQGRFIVVTMKIANHARRVNYTFNKAVAILVDEDGREYHLSDAGQKALEAGPTHNGGCESEIPAGASCVTDVVFEVPNDARLSHFRISEGGMVGDVLDTVFYGRKIIKFEQ
jgi:hypothetical protein